jgi:hypothetical protein
MMIYYNQTEQLAAMTSIIIFLPEKVLSASNPSMLIFSSRMQSACGGNADRCRCGGQLCRLQRELHDGHHRDNE